jgi:hypothetical protein
MHFTSRIISQGTVLLVCTAYLENLHFVIEKMFMLWWSSILKRAVRSITRIPTWFCSLLVKLNDQSLDSSCKKVDSSVKKPFLC